MNAGGLVPEEIEALFDEMIRQQRAKVLAIARCIAGRLTEDDILNPQDFPELAADARFGYEDGVLAGLISAQVAVRARFRQMER